MRRLATMEVLVRYGYLSKERLGWVKLSKNRICVIWSTRGIGNRYQLGFGRVWLVCKRGGEVNRQGYSTKFAGKQGCYRVNFIY